MTMSKSVTAMAACAATAAMAAAWVYAGTLNPPAGAVAPTMKTNQEIFDAVQGGSGGPACELGTPGAVRGLGSCTLVGLPGVGATGTFSIYAFSHSSTATSGGGGGTSTIGPVVITKAIDSDSHRLFRALTQGIHPTTATITLKDGAGNYYTYLLTDVAVTGVKPTMMYRCDGTAVHGEEVTLAPARVRYTELATGHFWEWNLQTGSGTGG